LPEWGYGVWEQGGFRKGKKTHQGEPVQVEPEEVTICTTDYIETFIGARGMRLRDHLRDLRDRGLLIHEEGRLTQRIRVDAPGTRYGVIRPRAYVFRGRKADVPRARPRARVIAW
jgi:hypothetical protein